MKVGGDSAWCGFLNRIEGISKPPLATIRDLAKNGGSLSLSRISLKSASPTSAKSAYRFKTLSNRVRENYGEFQAAQGGPNSNESGYRRSTTAPVIDQFRQAGFGNRIGQK